MIEIPLRSWRVFTASPSGLAVWFDPEREVLRLFSRDGEESLERAGVDTGPMSSEVDSMVSVSELECERRARSGNDQLDLMDLEGPHSSVEGGEGHG